jgi:hypothetical protein
VSVLIKGHALTSKGGLSAPTTRFPLSRLIDQTKQKNQLVLINTALPGNARPAAAGTRPPACGAIALLCLILVQRPGALARPGAGQALKGKGRGTWEGRPRREVVLACAGWAPLLAVCLGCLQLGPALLRPGRGKREAGGSLPLAPDHNPTPPAAAPRTAGAAGVPPAARKNPKASPTPEGSAPRSTRSQPFQHPQIAPLQQGLVIWQQPRPQPRGRDRAAT